MTRTRTLVAAIGTGTLAAAIVAVVVVVAGCGTGDATTDAVPAPVIVELRVYQHIDDPDDLRVSARLRGDGVDALSMLSFGDLDRTGRSEGYADVSHHRYGDAVLGGVAVRVWQRETAPESIFVQACPSTSCRAGRPGGTVRWRPLGMNPLPLDDGISEDGRYRYGDLTVAIPRDNARLLIDREHLLALRDVLEGGATELDWDVGAPTTEWEGVTVSGSPPRVTGLDLSNRGLAGEIWGYLGDLAELTELRLDGNALTGTLPLKVGLLGKLDAVYLGGNDLAGCIPPPLRRAADHDLDSDSVVLAECAIDQRPRLVYDAPPGLSVRSRSAASSVLCDLAGPFESIWDAVKCGQQSGVYFRDSRDRDTWLFLDDAYSELERSPYSGCIYDCDGTPSQAALVEQLAASVWLNHAVGEDRQWVWP